MNDAGIKRTGIERRTLLKGAAWSVPVLAAAAAVPAYAASITCSAYSVRGTGFTATGSTFSAQYSLNTAAGAQSLAGWTLVIDLQPAALGSTLSITSHVPAGATVSTSAIAGGGTRIQVTNITGTSISFGGTFTGGFTGSAIWTNGTCTTTAAAVSFETFSLVFATLAGTTNGDIYTRVTTLQVKGAVSGFMNLSGATISLAYTTQAGSLGATAAGNGAVSFNSATNKATITGATGTAGAKFATGVKKQDKALPVTIAATVTGVTGVSGSVTQTYVLPA